MMFVIVHFNGFLISALIGNLLLVLPSLPCSLSILAKPYPLPFLVSSKPALQSIGSSTLFAVAGRRDWNSLNFPDTHTHTHPPYGQLVNEMNEADPGA